ncbi:unnamed protein product [Lathyrus oleraceus]
MEFKQLSCLVLIFLTFVEIDALQSDEEYWKSVWPNTPIPNILSGIFIPDKETNVPIRGNDEDQDWTAFFQHDLYPGKKISLGFHKNSNRQSLRSKAGQPLGTWIWSETHSLRSYCTNPAAIGEEKYCAPSLKSMMHFAISKLGKNIKVISSSFAENQDQYVVEEVKKIGDDTVMCHRLNLEKVVFYCHQVNATSAYMVPLVASDGTKAKALTICHHDTRGMDPKVLYEVLKVKPGGTPICHFVSNKAIAWVPDYDGSELNDNHPCVI